MPKFWGRHDFYAAHLRAAPRLNCKNDSLPESAEAGTPLQPLRNSCISLGPETAATPRNQAIGWPGPDGAVLAYDGANTAGHPAIYETRDKELPMATQAGRLTERRYTERRSNVYTLPLSGFVEGLRVSWGGIWAGVLVASGVVLLLTSLGLAVGITAADPAAPDAQAMGLGAGLWAGVTLLIALFVGGVVSTRVGAIFDRTTSVLQGTVVWVVSVLLMAYLAASGIGMVAGGALRLVGGVGAAAVGVAATGQQEGDFGAGSVDQILARLKDPQTAQKVSSATGIPQADVQSTLSQTAQRVEAVKDRPTEAAAAARDGMTRLYEQARASGQLQKKAAQAQPAATRTAWITFGALILSLLAAVIGSAVGRRSKLPAAVRPDPEAARY